ncbi:GTPase domain-containing protein [bacterium]|nr:GTPase domain-containing protein [bacterium]
MMELTGGEDFRKQQKELNAELEAKLSTGNLPTANILVAGITGTGKSTLVNAIFGSEMAATGTGEPITKEIKSYGNNDIPVHIWDTVGLELDSTTTRESIRNIKQTIAEKSSSKDPFDRIHCIWYCINSGSNRYQGAELEFIKELYSVGVPFIIILTQCWGDENEVNNFEKEIRRINSEKGIGNIDIVQVMAQEMKMRGLPPIPPFGLDKLVDTTLAKLPDFIKDGFIAAQKVSKDEKRAEGEKIIMEYVEAAEQNLWSNLPIINLFSADRKIKNLFVKLSKMYNMNIPEEKLKDIILTFESKLTFALTRILSWKHLWSTILPWKTSFDKELENLFSKEDLSEEMKYKFDKAKIIAFYGYIFMDSVDTLWDKLTSDQLKDIDFLITNLTATIKLKLNQYK